MRPSPSRITILAIISAITILIMVKIIFPFCIKRNTDDQQVGGQLPCCNGAVEWWHPSTLPVPITINRTGSKQAPGEMTANAVRRAMATWNAVNSAFFGFSDAGLTDKTSLGLDGTNIVVFDVDGSSGVFPVGSNILAGSATFSTTDQLGYRAFESDLIFNARDFQFTVGAKQNSFDIESITLHELGHHLGLSHPGGGRDTGQTNPGSAGCGPPVPSAVMWFATSTGINKRVLQPDDIAGVTQIYPKWSLQGVVAGPDGAGVANTPIQFIGTSVLRDTITVGEIVTDAFGLFDAPVLDSAFSLIISRFGLASLKRDIVFASPGSQFQNIQLQALPTNTLRGSVLDQESGTGISAKVELFAQGKVFRTVTTDADGNFTFADIPISDSISTVYEKLRIEPELPYPVVETTDNLTISAGPAHVINFELSPAELLVVDEDLGDTFETLYTKTLQNIGKSYVVWDVKNHGSVKEGVRTFPGKTIIWFTGNAADNILSPVDLDTLKAHLARGGTFFLTGQNIAENLAQRGSEFLSNVLHVSWESNVLDPIVHGVHGDPVGDGLDLIALAGGDGARNQLSQDVLLPDDEAYVVVVHDTTDTTVAGVRIDEAVTGVPESRVVFFGFGLEGVNNLARGFATREQLMTNVLNWLNRTATSVQPGAPVSGMIAEFALLPNYPNPFNGETIIRYQIPSKVTATPVALAIYNLLGQKVRTLIEESAVEPGEYSTQWDGRNDAGSPLPSGLYLYKLQAGPFQDVKKLIYVK